MATEDKDDYYTKTAADAEFLTSNQGSENSGKFLAVDSQGEVVPVNASGIVTPEGEASILDNSQPKNLFGEITTSETVVVPATGIADLEEAPGTSLSTTNTAVCLFTPVDQQAIHGKKIYQIRLNVATGGQLDCYIVNLNVTGRLIRTSDFPQSITAYMNTAVKLFTANITETGTQNIKLDGTDSRVTYINQDFVEDGYIKVPEGYYLSFCDAVLTGSLRTVWYYGGDQPSGNKYHFVYFTTGQTAPTISGTSSSSLSISIDIAEEQTIITTIQNFDSYLVTKEETTKLDFLHKSLEINSTANSIKGCYAIQKQGSWNGKYITAIGYYGRADKPMKVYCVTVSDNDNVTTSTANSDIAAIRAGTGEDRLLFTITPTETETTLDQKSIYKLDGTDSRVVINNQSDYDVDVGGFLWNSTKMLLVSDMQNPSSSSSNTTNCMFYASGVQDAGTTGFLTTNDSGWNIISAGTLLMDVYTNTTVCEETVHSDVINNALQDIEELKQQNVESSLKGKYISFLGDSITTWEGWSNIAPGSTSAAVWYPKSQYGMTDVNQSYWKKLIDRTGAKLLVNNSWSGSRCANSGSGPVVSTTNDRCSQLHKTVDGVVVKPDYIVINIGTNDFDNNVLIGTWNGRGERFPDNPDTVAPTTFREAYSVMLHRLRKNYPLAKIYCCTIPCGNVKSDGLNEINSEGVSLSEYNDAIREVATAYGVRIVELATSGLDYYTLSSFYCDSNLHPNEAGMERYYELIRGALESNDSSNVSTPRLSKLMTGTATAISDSTASDVSGLVADFNALLAALRARGVISAS